MEPYSADDIRRRKKKFDFFNKKLLIDTRSFNNILSKIIKSVSGIKKVILVDRAGLTIANVSKFSYFPIDVDGVGAIASAVYIASEEQGKNLDIGDLEIVTSEFSGGKIFASVLNVKAILTLICESDINIGLIRLILKRLRDEMKEIFGEFEYFCQYCGKKITKKEQFTHSCNRFFLG